MQGSNDYKDIKINNMLKPTRIEQVEFVIAKAANITVSDLYSKDRTTAIVDARHAVWYIITRHMGYSSAYVGRLYKRDHTTVLSGVKRIENSDMCKIIIKNLKEWYPKALIKMDPARPRSIENWDFKE